ncbi:site-specific recombinase [Lacisediminimonas profundi]|uniref:site-specific recombinase n=1 Tax=Lacisediminimonas profundi TaxID=2603856 RepID=UPI001386BD7A|nr:site-specific recombinase [Lacisediminimonas profundi]
MKFYLLRAWARCRRLLGRNGPEQRETRQVGQLMRRASPFGSWTERAHWMVDVAAWLRAEPPVWSEQSSGLVCAHRRTRLLLDWLQQDKERRRLVQTTVQKTLREAVGPELFCGAGLRRRAGILHEVLKRIGRMVLPGTLVPGDLSALLLAMFPDAKDERWLRSLDAGTRRRLWKLIADDGIGHSLQQQIDEALHFLVNAVVATGIGPEVRQRLGARLPLRATPFMALRLELEKYLALPAPDEGAMRSVRMLLAVCQAQTDKVYEHLDEYGVSVSLVVEIEQLRARLTRMARLMDLRSAVSDDVAGHALQIFLAESVRDHHRSAAGSMIGRSFSLLARKLVERNDRQQEHYVARDRNEYSDVLRAGCVGGAVLALTVLGVLVIESTAMAGFFELLAYSSLFAASLLAIAALGGVLAVRQSPVVAPILAAHMGLLDTVEGLRGLLKDSAALLRAQVAAAAGNLLVAVPAVAVMAVAVRTWGGTGLVSNATAGEVVHSLSVFGPTPLFAVLTGLMFWLASLAAGLADNWFVLHRLRDAVAHHPGLRMLFGAARTQRFADWSARHVPAIAGGLSLAVLLGMLPVVGEFFGMPLDVRHGVLSAGMLTVAAISAGLGAWQDPSTWLAVAGVVASGLINVGTAFFCSLALAMFARNVNGRARRMIVRSLWRRLRAAPLAFVLPPKWQPVAPVPRVRRREAARTLSDQAENPGDIRNPDRLGKDRTGTD